MLLNHRDLVSVSFEATSFGPLVMPDASMEIVDLSEEEIAQVGGGALVAVQLSEQPSAGTVRTMVGAAPPKKKGERSIESAPLRYLGSRCVPDPGRSRLLVAG